MLLFEYHGRVQLVSLAPLFVILTNLGHDELEGSRTWFLKLGQIWLNGKASSLFG